MTEGEINKLRKLNKKQKAELLIEIFSDTYGNVDLSDLDFGERKVYLSRIKASVINNSRQKAGRISNVGQYTKTKIDNKFQRSELIVNVWQRATEIILNNSQKAEIRINNNGQEASKKIT